MILFVMSIFLCFTATLIIDYSVKVEAKRRRITSNDFIIDPFKGDV